MDLKDRLKELRNEKGLSVSEMARDFEKAESTVRMWESGNNNPDIHTLSALADYFNVTTDYLLCKSQFKKDDARTLFEQEIEHLPASKRAYIMKVHNHLLECAEEYEKYFSVDRVDFFENMVGDVCTIIDAYKAIPMDLLHYNTLIVVKRFLDKMTLTHYAEVIHRISQGFDGRRDVDNDGEHS